MLLLSQESIVVYLLKPKTPSHICLMNSLFLYDSSDKNCNLLFHLF